MQPHRPLLHVVIAMLVAIAASSCGKAPEAGSTSPAATPAGVNVSDINVTEHVMTALHQSASLASADISVVTLKGDVRLIGVADTQAQIDDALRIARAAEGSHTIHNELAIRK